MPHIFFEKLEKRRSTQSLFSGSGLFGNDLFASGLFYGVSPPTDYNPIYMPFPSSWFRDWLPDYSIYPWSTPSSWLSPWPSMSPWVSSQYSLMPWLSPLPSQYSSSFWYNLRDIFPWTTTILRKPIDYEPDPTTMMCYAIGPPRERSSASPPLSKLENVRKRLIAHFRDKGIISKENSLKLLSSGFDKA